MILPEDLLNDPTSQAIYLEYLNLFEEMWSLPAIACEHLGRYGNALFEAEFQEWGAKAYETSVVYPIRNAWYCEGNVPLQWENTFKHLPLEEPLLDYGCGVGFLLRWLQEQGMEGLWGHDIGMNGKVFRRMARRNDIREMWWRGPFPEVKTILCVHVLEHVEDPMSLLNTLRKTGAKVYAGISMAPGHGHIAPMKERERVLASLTEHGELLKDFNALQTS